MLTEELIHILACPVCKGPLTQEDDSLLCEKCMLVYPVEDNIPLLLEEKAVKKA